MVILFLSSTFMWVCRSWSRLFRVLCTKKTHIQTWCRNYHIKNLFLPQLKSLSHDSILFALNTIVWVYNPITENALLHPKPYLYSFLPSQFYQNFCYKCFSIWERIWITICYYLKERKKSKGVWKSATWLIIRKIYITHSSFILWL